MYDQAQLEVVAQQVALAKQHGVSAFCHYHYWFDGQQLLETPTNLFLDHRDLDLGICLAWANHTWSRRWDGQDHLVLIEQTHPVSRARWGVHFDYLQRAFTDPRAFTVDKKPVFVIYQPQRIAGLCAMLDYFRERALAIGLPGLYFVCMDQRLVARPVAIVLLLLSAGAFVATTAFINPLCFSLSPVALLIVFFYSLTKRFTDYTQLFLGLALAVSPVGRVAGGAGAVRAGSARARRGGDDVGGRLRSDLRDDGLRLRPHGRVAFAGGAARDSERVCGSRRGSTQVAFVGLAMFGVAAGLGAIYFVSLVLVFGAFLYEHRSVAGPAPLDVGAVNNAFFNANAFVGSGVRAGGARRRTAAVALTVFKREPPVEARPNKGDA